MLILSTAKKVKQISKCYNIDSRDYLNIDSRDSKNMENKNQESEKMITLKEAAKISGYAPDYVGQLIRKGKLPGKQVYHSVAWMTTEAALREYLLKEKTKGPATLAAKAADSVRTLKTQFQFQLQAARLFKSVLYVAMFISICFSLLLFYIFSVSLEKHFDKRALERAEGRATVQ